MAGQACTKDNLVAASACYTKQFLPANQQKAALIFMLTQVLSVLGGTDYQGAMSTTLISDSNTALCGVDSDTMKAMLIAIAQEAAGNADTIDGIAIAIRCLEPATSDQMNKAIVFLLCAIKNQLVA